MTLAVIERVEVEAGPTLRLRFADGTEGVLRIAELIARGGVFRALEAPHVLNQVRIGDRG